MKGKAQMSTSPHVNDVFDAFVAAKQAIDKVPDLEAQIAKLTADLQTANQMVEQYDIELAHHKEALSQPRTPRPLWRPPLRPIAKATQTCRLALILSWALFGISLLASAPLSVW